MDTSPTIVGVVYQIAVASVGFIKCEVTLKFLPLKREHAQRTLVTGGQSLLSTGSLVEVHVNAS